MNMCRYEGWYKLRFMVFVLNGVEYGQVLMLWLGFDLVCFGYEFDDGLSFLENFKNKSYLFGNCFDLYGV